MCKIGSVDLYQQRLQRTVWFCAWHFIIKTTKKANGYHQMTAQVSLQLVPVLVDVEGVCKEKDCKVWRGVFFFFLPLSQTPTSVLSCDTAVAVASRVGCDLAATLWSAMMNLKDFSVQSVFHCYIRRTHPSGGQGSRESSCKSVSHSSTLPSSPCLWICWQLVTHRVMWLFFFLPQFCHHFS